MMNAYIQTKILFFFHCAFGYIDFQELVFSKILCLCVQNWLLTVVLLSDKMMIYLIYFHTNLITF